MNPTYVIRLFKGCRHRSTVRSYNLPDELDYTKKNGWLKEKPSSGVSLNAAFRAIQMLDKCCEYEVIEV